jgi:hypothetical protein
MTENAAIVSSSNNIPSIKSNVDVLKIARSLGLEELVKSTNTFDITNSYKLINAKSKVIDRIVNILDAADIKLKSADINIETGKLLNYLIPKAGEGLLDKYDFVNQVKLIEIREKLYDIIFKAADDIGDNITKTLATQKGSIDTLLSYIIPKARREDFEDTSKNDLSAAQNTIYSAIKSSATEIASNIITGAAKDAKFKDAIKYVLGDVAQFPQLNDTANQIKEIREFVFLKIKQGLELVAEEDSMRSIVKDLLGFSEDPKTLLSEDLPWWAKDEDIQELKQKGKNKQPETPTNTLQRREESFEEYINRNKQIKEERLAAAKQESNTPVTQTVAVQQSVIDNTSKDINLDSDILQQVEKEPVVVTIADRSLRDLTNLQVSELDKLVRPIGMLEEKVIESFEKLAKKIDDLEINSGEESEGTDLISTLEGAALGRASAGKRGSRTAQRASRLNKVRALKGLKALKVIGPLGAALGIAGGAYDFYNAEDIEDKKERTIKKSEIVGETTGSLVGGGLGMWGGAALGTAIAGPIGTVIGGIIGGLGGGFGGEKVGSLVGEAYAKSKITEEPISKKTEEVSGDRDAAKEVKPATKSTKDSTDSKDTKPAPPTSSSTPAANLNIDTYNYSHDREQVAQLKLINDTLMRLSEANNVPTNQYSAEPAEASTETSLDNDDAKSNEMLYSRSITDYRYNIRNAYSV